MTLVKVPAARDQVMALKRKSAPRPRWAPPSRFVTSCLAQTGNDRSGVAADFGSGYGRNTLAAAMQGWNIIAFDLDRNALTSLMTHYGMHRAELGGQITAVCADLSQRSPIRPATFALVMLIEYSIEIDVRAVISAVRTDGYLILETFQDRGENWRGLPSPGALHTLLGNEFDLLRYSETPCRQAESARCTTKVFARRHSHSL
ncbi:methyltransferase domain-containing protein [Dongia sp.]|uniref:methyltransferase domain-containing protein n=1 Tax=Dongia sp. TaxID=1977262 RepID=UPI0035B45A0C